MEDIFLNKSDFKIFVSSRHNTKNTHGTGCTLSSAITTFFSCGKSIKKACDLGIKYVNSAILTNPKYGKGHGPINHINSMKINKRLFDISIKFLEFNLSVSKRIADAYV